MDLRCSRLAALALLVLAGCGTGSDDGAEGGVGARAHAGGTPARPAIPAGAPKVVFLGDSLTAGLHLDSSQAFPAVLQRLLAAEGEPFELVDAGVSGDTSAGGLRRLDWLLKQAPDVLVLELGANDGLRGQSVAEIEARLREIATRAKAAGVRVLLLGMRLPPSLGREYVESYEALYPRLASELELEFVPTFLEGVGGVAGMMFEDGLHPNAAGHKRLAENIAPYLRKLVDEVAVGR